VAERTNDWIGFHVTFAWADAASSLRQGLAETLKGMKSGVAGLQRRTPATTKPIEPLCVTQRLTARMMRWPDGDVAALPVRAPPLKVIKKPGPLEGRGYFP
jgi:hypothetical protein